MQVEDFVALFKVGSKQSINAVISIMQSFEVILLLDQQSILIPSLMSQQRENACAITRDAFGRLSMQSTIDRLAVPIATQTHHVLSRHYILPFVPNGFFTRLISRICTSPLIIAQCEGVFGGRNPRWRCWRGGVCLVCNDTEVLKIVPATYPLPGTDATFAVTGSGRELVEKHSGIVVTATPLLPSLVVGSTSDSYARAREATWLLQQAIDHIDSIFADWYVAFGRRRGFELAMILQGVPCDRCEGERHTADAAQQKGTPDICGADVPAQEHVKVEKSYFLFPSSFCAHMVATKQDLQCPLHGRVSVSNIAPDLVSRKCSPCFLKYTRLP